MTVILPEAGAAPSGRYVVRAVDGHLANAVAGSGTNHGADSGVDSTNSNASSGDHGATSRTAWISYERGV
ncbi:MAG: hypothetical protein M3483_09145, partial [Gemmatimonadota bacterium]|nr:hypothetical protein [Gemmatimonadota bacterium]